MALHTSNEENKAKEITVKTLEKLGVISKYTSKGTEHKKELRYVSWNGGDPKYDIRVWYKGDDGKEHSTKGLTFTGEELLTLVELINKANA